MTLHALSPLDGRYENETTPLRDYFSEFAFLRDRVRVELAEDGIRDALAERLDQLVLLVRRHVLHHLVDALVVDGLADAVAAAGGAGSSIRALVPHGGGTGKPGGAAERLPGV